MTLCLFDLDGTLIDSEPGIFGGIRYALGQLDTAVPDERALRAWIGPPLRQNFGALLDAERVEQAVKHYHVYFAEHGWQQRRVYDGIPEALAAIHSRGDRLAVVTSKIRNHADRIIADLPFGHLFERVYAPGPESAHSQKASMIAAAIEDFASPRESTVMVGDRSFDIEGAVANHIASVGVLWGFGDEAELIQAGAAKLAHHPSELPGLT